MERVSLSRSEDFFKRNENVVGGTAVMAESVVAKGKLSKLFSVGAIVVLVFVLDQMTKSVVLRDLQPLGRVDIIPNFFSLTFIKNKGAAFGMFGTLPTPYRELSLGIVSLIALAFVFKMLLTDAQEDILMRVSLSLILGGALGNLLDRARHGAVVDFLDFYIGEYHWPAFNVADSAISLGVTFLLLTMLFSKSQAKTL